MELAALKADVDHLQRNFKVSERHACELIGIAVSTYRHRPSQSDDQGVREKLVEIAREKPRYGYRRLLVELRRAGFVINHKRLYRLYRELGLAVKRQRRKRLVRMPPQAAVLTAANQRWALDFAHDGVEGGRAIRVLAVVDCYTRECLALEVDTSFPSKRLTRVLDKIIAERGRPDSIICDNGPEMTSRHFVGWAGKCGVAIVRIEPGRPTQNGMVESFIGHLRDECLNTSWFRNLFDARRQIGAWRRMYNESRPHSSLGYLTPSEFAANAASTSSLLKNGLGRTESRQPFGRASRDLDSARHYAVF